MTGPIIRPGAVQLRVEYVDGPLVSPREVQLQNPQAGVMLMRVYGGQTRVEAVAALIAGAIIGRFDDPDEPLEAICEAIAERSVRIAALIVQKSQEHVSATLNPHRDDPNHPPAEGGG